MKNMGGQLSALFCLSRWLAAGSGEGKLDERKRLHIGNGINAKWDERQEYNWIGGHYVYSCP